MSNDAHQAGASADGRRRGLNARLLRPPVYLTLVLAMALGAGTMLALTTRGSSHAAVTAAASDSPTATNCPASPGTGGNSGGNPGTGPGTGGNPGTDCPADTANPAGAGTGADSGGGACTGTCVQYNGGGNGVITESPKVYLVFYGSQWGGNGGDVQSQNEGFFKGLGKGGERWSRVLAQYCNAVPQGTQTCPADAAHIPYPTSTVYAGTWFDSSQAAPPTPGDDLITEARSAASHFGVSDLAGSIFIVFTPPGTVAGGGGSWHTTTGDGYNVINAAQGEQSTIVTSHEYAETMTDVNAGWTTADKTSEVADLCGPDGNLDLPTGSFPVTSIWSNQDSACSVAD